MIRSPSAQRRAHRKASSFAAIAAGLALVATGPGTVAASPPGAADGTQCSAKAKPAHETGESRLSDGSRKVWDVLFWRPVYLAQLVGGVAALPVALPLSAVIGDWQDAIDICVTGPAEMAFDRPLGQ